MKFSLNIQYKTLYLLLSLIIISCKEKFDNEIEIINKDTFNVKNNFFSARRSISRNENDYGRNISIIMIN